MLFSSLWQTDEPKGQNMVVHLSASDQESCWLVIENPHNCRGLAMTKPILVFLSFLAMLHEIHQIFPALYLLCRPAPPPHVESCAGYAWTNYDKLEFRSLTMTILPMSMPMKKCLSKCGWIMVFDQLPNTWNLPKIERFWEDIPSLHHVLEENPSISKGSNSPIERQAPRSAQAWLILWIGSSRVKADLTKGWHQKSNYNRLLPTSLFESFWVDIINHSLTSRERS